MALTVRLAEERDLDALAGFEAEIARVSFADEAVTDLQTHRKKLAKALPRDRDGMFVADDGTGRVVGWLWLAINQNFLTGERYANFRSLAVAPDADREAAVAALFEHAIAHAEQQEATSIVGRVHVDNTGMRVLYRRYGFEPAHLTMRRVTGRHRTK